MFIFILFFAGWVPPVYRGAAASRQSLLVYVVQPAGTEAQILQETREEDDDGGGEEGQGGTPGTYSRKKCEGHKSPVCEGCNWNILWYLRICPGLSCWYHKRRFGLNRIALIVFLIEPCTIQRSQHFWLETTKTLCCKWTFLTFGNNIINARLISLFSSFYYYM